MSDQRLELERALATAVAELNAARQKIAELEAVSDLGCRLVGAGAFQMDLDAMEVHRSDNALSIFGVSKGEFHPNHTSVNDFVHPDDRASFDATIAQVIATHGPYSHRHRIVRPNGEVRHVREAALIAGGGKNSQLLGIVQDVTDLVETKAAEVELGSMVKLAGEIAKVGGWTVDLDTQMVEISPVTASFHDAPDLRTMPLSEAFAYYSDESRTRLQAAVAESIETGKSFDETGTLVSRIGRERTVHVIGFVERDPTTNRAVGLKGAIKDITELVQARETLQRSAEFAAMAGHVAKLGSWRFDLARQELEWSAETAIIHDEPPGMSPTLDDAINYYMPKHRDRIRTAFGECLENGRPFDEALQIVTAKGRHVWVRGIGERVCNAAGQPLAVQGAFQDITDLMAERSASAELSRRLQRMQENANDATFSLDADWRFLSVNRKATAFMQRSRDDLVGKVVWEEFPEAAGSTFQTQMERVVKDRNAVRFVEFFAPLDKWIEVDAFATPEGVSVYFRDFMAQRASLAQLRLLEAAVSRQNDVLVITDSEPLTDTGGPKIVYVNDAFERITGYSRAEVIGKSPKILQGPKTQRDEQNRIRKLLQEWKPVRAELINYTKSGEEIWLELDIVPLADETGVFTHWVGVERDITDRKRTELALKINEERFRLIARAAGNVIWERNLVEQSHWFSEGMKEIFGHEIGPDQEWYSVWQANVHPEDLSRMLDSDRRLEVDGKPTHEHYRFRCADGRWAIVEERAFAIRDPDGRVVRFLGSMTDISERVHLESRLRQAQKMEAVGEFTGGLAHDFNNLLTIVMGNAELLSDALGDRPNLQRMANTVLAAADRGAEMTKRLLAFSRKQALAPRVINLGRLVQGIEGILRQTLPENTDIKFFLADDLWNAELDPGQLESALLNLVLNARDAMPEGGLLTIETANCTLDEVIVSQELDVKAGQYVMLAVTDTGHGIPKDEIGRVFEPFFTTKEVGKGSGLGLSMAYGFAKQSGGHIRVYSEQGEGTGFRLYFPRAMGKEDQQQVNDPSTVIRGGLEVILAVEDDNMVREHVVGQLSSMGYRVLEAASGSEAVEILKQDAKIDLLFTDVVMPGGMSGPELASTALAMRPEIKVLFTSGYTENALMHGGRLDQGVHLLTKPYRTEQLALLVRQALSGE
jgi:PAS domain S-box-containing protein